MRDLGAEFFAANRAALKEAFEGTAPIVLAGNSWMQRSMDISYDFVQDTNFWYVTGLNDLALTLVIDGQKEYLILPQRNKVRETFEGGFDIKQMILTSGIESILEHEEGWARLSRRVNKVKHIATLQPAPAYVDHFMMFTNPSRLKLVERLKELNDEIDLIDLRPVFARMRVIKSDNEVKAIQAAIHETGRLFGVLEKARKKDSSEYKLAAKVHHFAISNQLKLAYEPVIASGANSLVLHYIENHSVLDKDGPLLLDIGLRVDNYAADITRTVFANPTKRHEQVYEAVLGVHEFACSLLKPGTSLPTYEEAIFQYMGEKLRELGLIRIIDQESVRKYYPHATSHFLGIDVHDVGDHTAPLEPGMVLTVEPGIYIPEEGIGIRLEDNILITEDGNKNLSDSIPKDIRSL